MPADLAPLSTLIGSNYPCLELFFMVPKVFEPLKFYCNVASDQGLQCLLTGFSIKIDKSDKIDLTPLNNKWTHQTYTTQNMLRITFTKSCQHFPATGIFKFPVYNVGNKFRDAF